MSVAVAQAMRYAGCPNRRSLGVSDVFPLMSSPLSTSPLPFSSGRGAVRQVLGLLFAYSGPPPSSLITPPSDSNRGTVAQPRCSTDNPVLAPLVAPQAKSFSAPTPTRTTPSTPERESLFAGQHTAHQRSSLRFATQSGLSLLGFFTRRSTGPRRTRTTPFYVLTQCNSLCACASSGATKQGPPSFVPAQVFQCLPHSKFGNWRRLGDGLSSAGIDEEEPKTKIF